MSSSLFTDLIEPPYYAVIFSSMRTSADNEYEATAERMAELAAGMNGDLGIESARGADGFGITVSYWRDESSIAAWRIMRNMLSRRNAVNGSGISITNSGSRGWNVRIAAPKGADQCSVIAVRSSS